MAEREPKRQRLSLGGPAVDTSFEDFLTTGSTKRVSSDEEEEIDQENLDPEDVSSEEELSEDDVYEDDPTLRQESKYLFNKIIWHQQTFQSSATKDIYYLLQARLILPDDPVAVTRMLRVPAILLFEQLSDVLFAAFDWGGSRTWKYTLEKRAQSSTTATNPIEFPDRRRTLAELKSQDLSTSTRPVVSVATMDSKHVRLMEVWHHTQATEVRASKVFFIYECDGPHIWYTSISFMGVADKNLQAVDLGLNVDEGQQIWCVGGSGACLSEWKLDDKTDEGKTRRHEWDIDFHNAELADLKVRDTSWYIHQATFETVRCA